MARNCGRECWMIGSASPAMKKALARAGKTIEDMDIIEPNEAFATPCLAFANALGYAYDDPRVNPTGGAIALGHPIGCSGARIVVTLLSALAATGGRYGLAALCHGTGGGTALAIERV